MVCCRIRNLHGQRIVRETKFPYFLEFRPELVYPASCADLKHLNCLILSLHRKVQTRWIYFKTLTILLNLYPSSDISVCDIEYIASSILRQSEHVQQGRMKGELGYCSESSVELCDLLANRVLLQLDCHEVNLVLLRQHKAPYCRLVLDTQELYFLLEEGNWIIFRVMNRRDYHISVVELVLAIQNHLTVKENGGNSVVLINFDLFQGNSACFGNQLLGVIILSFESLHVVFLDFAIFESNH